MPMSASDFAPAGVVAPARMKSSRTSRSFIRITAAAATAPIQLLDWCCYDLTLYFKMAQAVRLPRAPAKWTKKNVELTLDACAMTAFTGHSPCQERAHRE